MEEVKGAPITGLKITTSTSGKVRIVVRGPGSAHTARATVLLDGREVASASGEGALELKIPDPKLWSPDSPQLYEVKVEMGLDTVHSYFGIRETGKTRDADGHWRFTLNGEEIFHWGTLDQGWWPDGLLTPPSDEAMVSDILFLKESGFNTIRKHIKIEPRRYYYHCDKIGMMVWQDHVSATRNDDPEWTRLRPDPPTLRWPAVAHRQFMAELQGMIDGLYSHPCIVQWVPFNERWGQHQTVEVGKWAVAHDHTRAVNIASGGNFFPVGDIVDAHKYPHPDFPWEDGSGGRFEPFVKVVGEFGGHGFPVEGHLWSKNTRNWGYGGLPENKEEWLERYETSIDVLAKLRKEGVAAGIYTQTTDVEGEINGLITYDRKVHKIPASRLKQIGKVLFP
jgi:beta-galactosidase